MHSRFWASSDSARNVSSFCLARSSCGAEAICGIIAHYFPSVIIAIVSIFYERREVFCNFERVSQAGLRKKSACVHSDTKLRVESASTVRFKIDPFDFQRSRRNSNQRLSFLIRRVRRNSQSAPQCESTQNQESKPIWDRVAATFPPTRLRATDREVNAVWRSIESFS